MTQLLETFFDFGVSLRLVVPLNGQVVVEGPNVNWMDILCLYLLRC